MALWLQNLLVALAVMAGVAFVCFQAWLMLAGKRSRIGSCCCTSCPAHEPAKPKPSERIVFLPAEMLGRKK